MGSYSDITITVQAHDKPWLDRAILRTRITASIETDDVDVWHVKFDSCKWEDRGVSEIMEILTDAGVEFNMHDNGSQPEWLPVITESRVGGTRSREVRDEEAMLDATLFGVILGRHDTVEAAMAELTEYFTDLPFTEGHEPPGPPELVARPVGAELRCPKCGRGDQLGTMDMIPGFANARVTVGDDGMPEVEYQGQTDVDWDAQATGALSCKSCGWVQSAEQPLLMAEEI